MKERGIGDGREELESMNCSPTSEVRGLKVNEGVTGPNVVLFLHRSTREEKKSTLTFKFYPVTKNSTDLSHC